MYRHQHSGGLKQVLILGMVIGGWCWYQQLTWGMGVAGITHIRRHWDDLDIVLLDVLMPHSGALTLAQISGEAQLRGQPRFPVVPFTISTDIVDLQVADHSTPDLRAHSFHRSIHKHLKAR
ncbi:MAG: hypothetical protein HC912_07205 [Saprospiraceae bacterium]|nr:hypothetical protein [Saprospiraceae bacterium]